MDAGLLYQNARVKSLETSLLGSDRLQRISDAGSVAEALRLLIEAGYPSAPTCDETLLLAEKEACRLFKANMAEGYGLELFLLISDYHNAKVAAKAHYLSGSTEGYKPEGMLAIASIEEALEKGEFKGVPVPMASAFASLEALNARESLLPSDVDYALDKAAFEAIGEGKKKGAKVIARYFDLLADLKNISVAFRAHRAGFTREKARRMLLPAGTISESDLLKIVDAGEDAAEKMKAESIVHEAIAALKEGLTAYEVFTDNALLGVLKKERYDMFSPAPIAGLYIGKQREITNVRLILARLANGVNKDVIKARMRELYV